MKKRYYGLLVGLISPIIIYGLVVFLTMINASTFFLIIVGLINAVICFPGHLLANIISPDIPGELILLTESLVWGSLGFFCGLYFERTSRSALGEKVSGGNTEEDGRAGGRSNGRKIAVVVLILLFAGIFVISQMVVWR